MAQLITVGSLFAIIYALSKAIACSPISRLFKHKGQLCAAVLRCLQKNYTPGEHRPNDEPKVIQHWKPCAALAVLPIGSKIKNKVPHDWHASFPTSADLGGVRLAQESLSMSISFLVSSYNSPKIGSHQVASCDWRYARRKPSFAYVYTLTPAAVPQGRVLSRARRGSQILGL